MVDVGKTYARINNTGNIAFLCELEVVVMVLSQLFEISLT